MMPRPLYRWKSFWFGLLVLGFLGWAWRDSFTRYTSVIAMRASASQAAGGIVFVYRPATSPFRILQSREALAIYAPEGRLRGFSSPQAGDPPVPLCPPFLRHEQAGLFVPHWFLVLLFFIPWVSFLAWRWRQQRKQTETNS